MPVSMPKRGANGTTTLSTSPRIARCPEIGAPSSSPASRRIAQRAKSTASPKPPPTRWANVATARSARPSRTASASAGRWHALAPRSPSHSTTSGKPSTRRAASVIAPPLPMSRPVETTSAPASRASAAVSSVEPSSATITRASGNASRSAPSVAGRRSASLCAATITTTSMTAGSVPRHA